MYTAASIPLVSQDYSGIVTRVTYSATNGLVDSFHAQVLIVNLARKLPISVFNLKNLCVGDIIKIMMSINNYTVEQTPMGKKVSAVTNKWPYS